MLGMWSNGKTLALQARDWEFKSPLVHKRGDDMSKADDVINRLEEETRTFHIKLTGNKKNRAQAFEIILLSQAFSSTSLNAFHGIKRKTLKVLREAEIELKIMR